MKSTPTRVLQTVTGRRSFHLLLIVVVGLAAYSNTFTAPFAFDDGFSIADNPVIKDLGNFTSSLVGYHYNPRRYIGYLTFALNYRFGGLGVTGYHIVNLAIHVINAVLVYFLVMLTFRTPYFSAIRPSSSQVVEGSSNNSTTQLFNYPIFTTPHSRSFIALFSALLFVAHPVQTQAVTYIVQRFTSLATMFYLLSVMMYIKGRLGAIGKGQGVKDSGHLSPIAHSPSPPVSSVPITHRLLPIAYFSLSLLSAVIAMKTKEIAFTLPIMIFLYEFTFFRSSLKKKLLFLIPILLTLAIIPLSMIHVNKPLGEVLSDLSEQSRVQTGISRVDYFMTEMRVIVSYLRLIFLPINQNLDYDYPTYHSFSPPVFLSFLLLSTLFGTAVYLLYKSRREAMGYGQELQTERRGAGVTPVNPPAIAYSRLVAFGIFWFFIALSVESSFIPIADVIFEHRVYLPSVGAFIALTAAAYAVAIKAGKRWPQTETVAIVLPLIIVLVLSGAAFARNMVWRDGLTLWNDVVSKAPGNARAFNNRGKVFSDRGQFDSAIEDFSKAISLNPSYFLAYLNRGSAFGNAGRLPRAVKDFSEAIALGPSALVYYLRGMAFETEGQTDMAIGDFERAITLQPAYLEAYIRAGILYGKSGSLDKAIERFNRAVAINPGYALAYANRGFAYSLMGQYNEAIGDLTRAIELNSNDADYFMNRGTIYLKMGKKGLAETDLKTACALGKKEACSAPARPK